jgi:diacylglycerol kinase
MRFPNFLNARFAICGIVTALREETQVLWGVICAVLMTAIALLSGITALEFAILLTLFGAVVALEMVNGAIERLCNKVEPSQNADIKKIKDLTSGAVLLIACVTLAVWVLFTFF